MTEQPPTAPLGAITPRQVFDELVRRKIDAVAEPGPAERWRAQCRAFADAVDDLGNGIPYGDAVVILGTTGPVVATVRDYDATPAFWETQAGEDLAVIDGTALMAWLHSD